MSLSRYIMPLLLVLLSGAMYIVYIEDTYANIIKARRDIKEFETAIKSAEEVRALQARLLEEVESIDPVDRARLEKLLPSSHDPVLVIYDLNTFARKHGLILKAPQVVVSQPQDQKPGAESSHVVPISIKFSVSAPYTVFRPFMADLERELALRDIQGLTITAVGASGQLSESSVFTYQVDVVGYAYTTGGQKKKAI